MSRVIACRGSFRSTYAVDDRTCVAVAVVYTVPVEVAFAVWVVYTKDVAVNVFVIFCGIVTVSVATLVE